MRRLLALCGAIAVAACNSIDSPKQAPLTLPTTDANVVGTFLLRSANGNVPPYIVAANNAGTQTLLDDRIVLSSDLTWADTTDYEVDLATGERNVGLTATAGTYNINAGQINFTMSTGGTLTFAGAVLGDTLYVLSQNHPFVYQR
jgi:hypothetical protein